MIVHRICMAFIVVVISLGVSASPNASKFKENLYVEELQQYLLLEGGDPNSPVSKGVTLLHLAARKRSSLMIELLLDAGADLKISCLDNQQQTPLHIAAFNGDSKIIQKLLAVSKDSGCVNIKNIDGKTPLHLAAERGHLEVIKELLAANANPYLPDKSGLVPLKYASENHAIKQAFMNAEANRRSRALRIDNSFVGQRYVGNGHVRQQAFPYRKGNRLPAPMNSEDRRALSNSADSLKKLPEKASLPSSAKFDEQSTETFCTFHRDAVVADRELRDFIAKLSRQPRFDISEKHHALIFVEWQLKQWNIYRHPYHSFRIYYSGGKPAPYTGTNHLTVVREASTKNATIILLVAHYDTVYGSPGTFDNAAGVGVAMFAAKLLAAQQSLPSSCNVWLLLTDYEESLWSEKAGSRHFVDSLAKQVRSRIKAVLTIDSIGALSNDPNSQKLPPWFSVIFPDATSRVRKNGNRGNFVASISAGSQSARITDFIMRAGQQCGIGKELPNFDTQRTSVHDNFVNLLSVSKRWIAESMICSWVGIKMLGTFNLCRSDHMVFWRAGIPAVHLTDTAKFRNKCYHEICDNPAEMLKPENVRKLTQFSEILASAVNLMSA